MGTAIAIATLLNLAEPGIAQIILMIKNATGGITILPILDSGDAGFAADLKLAQDWLAAHPVKS